MSPKTGKHAIIEQFLADGITHMFGNPGTVEQGFLDALEDYPEFKYILTLQETIAVAMADGYARKTKKPTVVQLHSGVGLGNGIGMIYQAKRGHAPLVVIAGESGIKYDGMDAQMAADLVSMAKPVTKWATRVVDSASLLRVLRRAIKIASTPPTGPVFVCLPMDILDEEISEEIIPTSFLNTKTSPSDSTLTEVVEALLTAKDPHFIIGDGIAISEAQEELRILAKHVGAKVWGADSSEVNMSASNPQFMGLLGHMFGEQSKAAVDKADVILISGTYLFPEVFPLLKDVFSKSAKLFHIDLDSYEIGKNFSVDVGIVSDPKTTFARLNKLMETGMTPSQKKISEARVAEMVKERAEKLKAMENQGNGGVSKVAGSAKKTGSPIHMDQFMMHLAEKFPTDGIIFDEALTSSPSLNRFIPADIPGQFFQTRGGSLGVGIPGALGIKLADESKTVIGFTGDGGSMYTIQALWTAAHHNIAAKFVICNNRSYRLLKLNIDQYWKERNIIPHAYPESFILEKPEMRFDKMAEAMGVPAVRVEKAEDIEGAIEKMLSSNGPFLIDLVIE